ncbi:DEAD/DEAH box helicase [Rhodococcus sp. IEGM 1408]|uniref:DEAD/DEAH box helicase n=1 Tax=Rhodococcus sp. IEGM 1408 TaxID=3082220 RepID=UPI002954E65B|nr:DEAD/DEAH box helicase [Rhodococcus sp. IEGM 1408]MDV8002802.1 DEAD/DEAH box helicase [Rhodococcus sp. IEGM 1408]
MNRDERRRLGAVIDELRAMVDLADSVRHRALHLPLSAGHDPTSELPFLDVVAKVALSGDLETASPLTRAAFFSGRKKLEPARAAGERLIEFYERVGQVGADAALKDCSQQLTKRWDAEGKQLRAMLNRLSELQTAAHATKSDVAHMPITRSGVLSGEQSDACERLLNLTGPEMRDAYRLLEPETCESNVCHLAHEAVSKLIKADRTIKTSKIDATVRAARERAEKLNRSEKKTVEKLADQASRWGARAEEALESRDRAIKAITRRVKEIQASGVEVRLSSGSFDLLPLTEADTTLLADLRLVTDQRLSAYDRKALATIRTSADAARKNLAIVLGSGGGCPRNGSCVSAHMETPAILEAASTIEADLRKLEPSQPKGKAKLDDITDSSLYLHRYLSRDADEIELFDAALTSRSKSGLKAIINAGGALRNSVSDVKKAAEKVHAADVVRSLKAMDLEPLKKAAQGSIRVSPLSDAGLTSVYDVFHFGDASRLVRLDGVGEASAVAIEQAARRLFEAVREETPVRIDVKRRDQQTEMMLRALRRWHDLRKFTPNEDELRVAESLSKLYASNSNATRVLCSPSGAVSAKGNVVATLRAALERGGGGESSVDIWKDFLSRPADYFGMLTELGYMTEDEKNMHGDLPAEIIEAVRAIDLKRTHLTASLRTYQSFGARFVLAQKRVVIGDEMGLGKTLEALAVFAHLRASGHTHFLVVCPAAVVSNWVRETSKHTTLQVSRVHGPEAERKQAVRSWIHKGGVAVTTFDLLTWATKQLRNVKITAAVFDEAHYIKNPEAKRSIASAAVMKSVPYVVLMTGTPLENKVLEFRNLIGYIRPDLAESAPEYLASRFRKHVAPAYLRRNQEDVLTELPEMVEIDEWMGMTDADMVRYRAAVEDGNFMQMRRAAMLSNNSMKFGRLGEIVQEAEENGRRVIVFSYFRDVLEEIAKGLPGRVFGPLTGSVPAQERQALVDRFSASSQGAVLVAQITAGGVGLNIQSASVVVICEPQIKPTMESQAIARAHRMGQTEVVQVHRLLTENSVDERIRALLKDKKQIFEDFARDSVIANRATDAVDMTDAELARIVVAGERERLLGQGAGANV